MWHVRILHQFITAYVDQTLISTGAARITAVPPFGFSSALHTAATVQFSNQKSASENDFSLTPMIASVVDLPDVSLHKPRCYCAFISLCVHLQLLLILLPVILVFVMSKTTNNFTSSKLCVLSGSQTKHAPHLCIGHTDETNWIEVDELLKV